MGSENKEKVIHVTGFGEFEGFENCNPSWEAVALLPSSIKLNGTTYNIIKHRIPVTYEDVDVKVPELWKDKPVLVIHCGVHRDAQIIHLEKTAHNRGFVSPDWSGKCLSCENVCLPNAGTECKQLSTKLDVDSIVKEDSHQLFKCATDPGSYLCGYLYLKSLDINNERTLFIHVPRLNEKFTIPVMADGILFVIKQCVEQLEPKCID